MTDGKTRVLDAADQLLGDLGYAQATFREIAAAANCRVGLVYHHFGTKGHLLQAVLERRLSMPSVRPLEELHLARDTNALVRQLVDTILSADVVQQDAWRGFLGLASDLILLPEWQDEPGAAPLTKLKDRFARRLRDLDPRFDDEGARAATIMVFAALFLAIGHHLRAHAGPNNLNAKQLEAAREIIARFCLGGLSNLTPMDVPEGRRPRARSTAVSAPTEMRGRIIDAAVALLAEQDPRAFSLRDVTARAGVTHSLMNYHFGTKPDLILAVIQDRGLQLRAFGMTAAERSGTKPGAAGAVGASEALIGATFDFVIASGGEGLALLRAIARLLIHPEWADRAATLFDASHSKMLQAAGIDMDAKDSVVAELIIDLSRAPAVAGLVSLMPRSEAIQPRALTEMLRKLRSLAVAFAAGGIEAVSALSQPRPVPPSNKSAGRDRTKGERNR